MKVNVKKCGNIVKYYALKFNPGRRIKCRIKIFIIKIFIIDTSLELSVPWRHYK